MVFHVKFLSKPVRRLLYLVGVVVWVWGFCAPAWAARVYIVNESDYYVQVEYWTDTEILDDFVRSPWFDPGPDKTFTYDPFLYWTCHFKTQVVISASEENPEGTGRGGSDCCRDSIEEGQKYYNVRVEVYNEDKEDKCKVKCVFNYW